jgi:hypothetical protein
MQAKGTPPVELKKIIQDRHKTGYYKAPERAGISYMLSLVLRTYFDPDESERVTTINYPHVMYHATPLVFPMKTSAPGRSAACIRLLYFTATMHT